jgi:hypothetical protein
MNENTKNLFSAILHSAVAAILFFAVEALIALNGAILANTEANEALLALHIQWFERSTQ